MTPQKYINPLKIYAYIKNYTYIKIYIFIWCDTAIPSSNETFVLAKPPTICSQVLIIGL